MKIAGVGLLILAFLVLLVAFASWGTIEAGNRGVLLRFGAVTGKVLEEGLYTKWPLIETVREVEVRVQKEQVETEGASKDLQTVKTIIALNLHPIPEKVGEIYQKVGTDYLTRIVDPMMQESIKAVLAQYTAEELISKRELVREAIKKLLTEKLTPYHIVTEDLNIVDFDFSPSFNAAIEMKVTAEQNALAAKNKLSQIEFEAQQKVAEARGKAEAMQIEADALESNPQILQLRALEKWNGILPQVTSGAVPFINLGDLKK